MDDYYNYCESCRKKLPLGTKFCLYCGKELKNRERLEYDYLHPASAEYSITEKRAADIEKQGIKRKQFQYVPVLEYVFSDKLPPSEILDPKENEKKFKKLVEDSKKI